MPGRIGAVSRLPVLLALPAALLAAGPACAHRLDAEVLVLPNRQIQVESWFSDGYPAKGAKVQVFGGQGQLLTEGQTNEDGIFVFRYGDTAPARVVVLAGAGHRKEVALSASALARARDATATSRDPSVGPNQGSPRPVSLVERDTGFPTKDLLIGVGFVLAASAFILSLRNAQKLRRLARVGEPDQGILKNDD